MEEKEEVLKETQDQKHLKEDQGASNDLDVFAKNEGGLVGVALDVQEVMELLQVLLSLLVLLSHHPKSLFDTQENPSTLHS